MNKQQMQAQREYFNMVHGVTVRAISAFADEELDFRPREGMRTPRELIFHIYAQEKSLAEAARQGKFDLETADVSNPESPANASAVGALATVKAAKGYAESCHEAAEAAVKGMSDDDLKRQVASPFGTYPAWRFLAFAYDEHWHHRGQLYTYLRLLGKEPTMLYDYGGGEA